MTKIKPKHVATFGHFLARMNDVAAGALTPRIKTSLMGFNQYAATLQKLAAPPKGRRS